MDSVGEGEGGKIWENGIETCKISCMKQKVIILKDVLFHSGRIYTGILFMKLMKSKILEN